MSSVDGSSYIELCEVSFRAKPAPDLVRGEESRRCCGRDPSLRSGWRWSRGRQRPRV